MNWMFWRKAQEPIYLVKIKDRVMQARLQKRTKETTAQFHIIGGNTIRAASAEVEEVRSE